MRARFVICANGTLAKPKLPKIRGVESFAGHSFPTSRWERAYTGPHLSKIHDKVVCTIDEALRCCVILLNGRLGGSGDSTAGRRRQAALHVPSHALVGGH